MLNSAVATVDPWKGSLELESGEEIFADLIIGADGLNSLAREVVLAGKPSVSQDDRVLYTFSVPLDELRADPDLSELVSEPTWNLWMADGCYLQGCAVTSRGEWFANLRAPVMPQPPDVESNWDRRYPAGALKPQLRGLGPRAMKLISKARELAPAVCVVFEPLEHWTHEGGKVVLAGNAAHSMLPTGSQSWAMAIEDAACIGNLFARLNDRAHIPVLLSAYEDIRQQRCAQIAQADRDRMDYMCMPFTDPRRRLRDDAFRASLASAGAASDDGEGVPDPNVWKGYVQSWAHDANEEVDDWWSKWGTRLKRREELGLRFEVASAHT